MHGLVPAVLRIVGRFRAYYDKYGPRMADFMRDAMLVYCEGT
jgi:hypothetical protein